MAIRPRVTEEFLWGLSEFLEGIVDINRKFGARSWKDVANPEWRNFRLAYEKNKRTKTFSQFVAYLKQKGYVKLPTGESTGPLQLTEIGKLKALKYRTRKTVWSDRKDGKMIMLMYDIPKKKQHVRQAFRSALKFLNYTMLQKSVWISSKDVLEETERAVRDYDLADCVSMFVIEKVRVPK
ncbi:MAG: hypothetical protein Q7S62_01140 [bacterium]|nr:hypothetical protein [bacterium]